MPYFTSTFGNAGEPQPLVWVGGEKAVEKARERIAKLIGATSKEIIFTSGATESNNLALKVSRRCIASAGTTSSRK